MEEEDSHYCLRCRSTIQGLDNYVQHRREKCQTPKVHEPSTATALHSYLNVNSRNGSSSNSLMTRNYLVYPPSKGNRSDPVLSSSSNHIEAERYNKSNQDANEHQNSLGVADLSVEVSADDFMNHLGLCMVSSNNWNSDMNSEEPLRADDFFTLLELQSCTKSSSDRPQRPRRSTEPLPMGSSERLRSSSDVFADLNSSHDSTSALELTGSEECLESATATFDISEPSSNNVSGETPDPPSPTLPLLPPSPTKLSFPSRGKWMPGLKPRDIHKSGSSVEYHCKPCNRRLTGRAVFEKHLQSELHFKRSAQHNQPSSTPLQHYGLRQKKTDAPSIEEKDESSADKQVISSPVRAGQAVLIDELDDEESDMWWMKRKKKGEKNARRCPICSVWVSQSLLGKHLVSRYHVNRSRNHPQRAQCILDNIHLIVLEAPFQCRLCRFYCHSHNDLLAHWKSTDHKGRDSETGSSARTYFCSVCRIGQLNCALMHNHLESERHLSIVDIVNKSVAVVISKLEPVQCHLCRVPSFRYRVQLNQHLAAKHSVPVGSISSICGRVFSCDHCTYKTPSSKAYTYHVFSCKAAPATGIKYRCLICDLSFSTKEESVRHRSTQEHRDTAGLKRSNPGSSTSSLNTRSCPHCYRSFNDLTGLKEHFLTDHPDLLPRCTRCGATFALKQQLSAHRRTVCQAVAESSTDVPAALLACNLCPYSCRIRADLLYHQAVEHREEVVGDGDTSSTSNAASTGPDNTSWTKQQHLYRCPDCGQGYGTKFSLKAHLVSHTGELAFRCHHCGRHFEREEERLAHIRQLHAPRPNIKGIQSVTPSTSSKRKRHSIPDAQQSSSSTPSTVTTEIPCAPESS